MSLNNKSKLTEVAKTLCRDLRKRATKAESIFWSAVRNRKFQNKKFYRQYPIFYDLRGNETFFIADFYCFEEKLIIELDGEMHKFKLKEDKERSEILNALGLSVLRFNNIEVEDNLTEVLKIISSKMNSSPSPFS